MEVLGPLSPVIKAHSALLMREIYSCNPEMRRLLDEMLIVSSELENKSVVVYFVSDHGSDEMRGCPSEEVSLRRDTVAPPHNLSHMAFQDSRSGAERLGGESVAHQLKRRNLLRKYKLPRSSSNACHNIAKPEVAKLAQPDRVEP